METWDAIRARRNVREYADRPIARQDLERILEAGRRSPSGVNEQRWDFVVVTDRQQLQELSKVFRGAWHVAHSAATVALVVPETDDPRTRDWIQFDLGQVTMSMMIAAADLGREADTPPSSIRRWPGSS
jgi:nitroreductase